MAKKKIGRQPRDVKALAQAAVAKLLRFAVLMGLPIQIGLPFALFPPALNFFAEHLTYLVSPAVILLALGIYGFANYSRTHPPKDKRGKPRRPVRAPRVPLKQVVADATDIIANLDHVAWRIIYLLGFLAAIIIPILVPVAVADIQEIDTTLRPVLLSAGIPAILALALVWRIASIMRSRSSWIDEIFAIARDNLDYKPLPERGTPTKRQQITATPHLAIQVRKWKNLTEGDTCFVWAPEKLSADDAKAWDKFGVNLEEKLPREEEWRIRTKGYRGRGALVGPANYPRAVLWDGEYDPDPLTFYLARDLETGDVFKFSLNSTSPHIGLSGGTSSGKSSAAEIIAAQVLMTPMPWDPNLRGTVDIIDPKDTFAGRWLGRPGVVVSSGVKNSEIEGDEYVYNEDGDVVCEKTGVMVMAAHVHEIEQEYQRRAATLSKYAESDAAEWLSLPEEVLKREQFATKLVIMDEFLDHTSGMKGKSDRIVMENEAREYIVGTTDYLLRKARNVGIHIIMIAQRANMELVGPTIMTNLPVRIVTGQIDDSQLKSMFSMEPKNIPSLPSTYRNPETGEEQKVQGRARMILALGQPVAKIQVMWFGGGKPNNKTLNKWLPRGSRPVNGDFSLPTDTGVRSPDEFDAEGNLIDGAEVSVEAVVPTPDEDDAAISHATSEAEPTDEEKQGSDDSEDLESVHEDEEAEPGDHEDSGEPEDAEDPEDAEYSVEGQLDDLDGGTENEDEDGGENSQDAPGIFPAATTEDSCESCDAESSWSCPECGKRYCTGHGGRTRNPDPEASGRFVCGECASSNPLVAVGMDAILPDVDTKVRRYKLHYEHTIRTDDNGEYGELRIRTEDGGKKIVEVFSRPHEGSPDNGFAYRARSSSGTVQGLAAVQDRIDVAVSTYVRARKEKTGGDAA